MHLVVLRAGFPRGSHSPRSDRPLSSSLGLPPDTRSPNSLAGIPSALCFASAASQARHLRFFPSPRYLHGRFSPQAGPAHGSSSSLSAFRLALSESLPSHVGLRYPFSSLVPNVLLARVASTYLPLAVILRIWIRRPTGWVLAKLAGVAALGGITRNPFRQLVLRYPAL